MEFYEFFEKLVSYVPADFQQLKTACENILPWLFGFLTLATSFAGHFMHKVWNIFFFFGIGFFVPLFASFVILKPTGAFFWVLVLLSAVIGVLCAVYSHKLHKTKLFITTLLMVYIAVSGYLLGLGKGIAILLGIIVAVIAALLAVKYKYLAVIVTTSFSGSMMFWDMIESHFAFNHKLSMIFAIVMGFCGLLCQCVVEKKELKETYEHIKENADKVKKKASLSKDKK
ncbi:hypothetical protein [Eubacterium sp.]|uniref:hypothetical protein n=1 Tax=Eubacterium sp. TaxID=142586 RepID=UPI003993DFEC